MVYVLGLLMFVVRSLIIHSCFGSNINTADRAGTSDTGDSHGRDSTLSNQNPSRDHILPETVLNSTSSSAPIVDVERRQEAHCTDVEVKTVCKTGNLHINTKLSDTSAAHLHLHFAWIDENQTY